MSSPPQHPAARWAALAALAALVLLSARSLDAPRPDPARAEALVATHRALFTDAPRPVGSPEAAAARARIAAALDAAGCETHEQVAWSCGKRACAPAHDLWCRIGPGTGAPIVGMAHTDSVVAGPGAADDGAGVVAWVDTVRHLDPATLSRPLIVALTDAEEPGLLGARAFFADPPFDGPAHAVVNLEARGTTGAAFLFQTVGAPLPWGSLAAGLPVEPRASSLYPTVYGWIPNDTDLTVAAAAGHPGVNHAFLGELSHYHTVHDDLAHLDPASLTQAADLAAAWVSVLQAPPTGDPTVFTDLFGWVLVRWPRSLARPATALLAAAVAGWVAADLRAGRVTGRELGRVGAGAAGAFLSALALAEGLGLALRSAGHASWHWPEPTGAVAGLWGAVPFLALGAAGSPAARWAVAASGLAALAAVGAAIDPGLTVLGLLPVAVAAALRLAPGEPGRAGTLIGAALPALPLAMGLPIVLGMDHPAVAAGPWAVAWLGASPFAPQRPVRWVAAAAGLAALATLALALAPVNAERPWPVNAIWDDTAGELLRIEERTGTSTAAEVEPLGLPGAVLEWRDARTLHVAPARGGRLEVASDTPYAMGPHRAPAELTTWWAIPPEGVDFVFTAPPGRLRVDELTIGLPAGVRPGRGPAERAVHRGDATRVRAVVPDPP